MNYEEERYQYERYPQRHFGQRLLCQLSKLQELRKLGHHAKLQNICPRNRHKKGGKLKCPLSARPNAADVVISISEKGCWTVDNDLHVRNINAISSHVVSSRKPRYHFWNFLVHLPSYFIFVEMLSNCITWWIRKNLRGKGALKTFKNTLFTRWLHIVTISDSSEDACLILMLDGPVTHSCS